LIELGRDGRLVIGSASLGDDVSQEAYDYYVGQPEVTDRQMTGGEGVAPEQWHNCRFGIDEESLAPGAGLHAALAFQD
jgi:hypothetical protein